MFSAIMCQKYHLNTVPGTAERSTTAVLVGPSDCAAVRDDVGLDAAVPARQLPGRHAARGKRGDLRKLIEIWNIVQVLGLIQ